MTLDQLQLPIPYKDCEGLAIVYPYSVAVSLHRLQEEYGDWRHVSFGVELSDARWTIGGGILSEVGPGGLYAWVTAHADTALTAQIDVVPASEIEGLLPPSP